MKKLIAIAFVFVLTVSVLTACRSKDKPIETTRPTMPPVTQETTVPTTQATQPTTTATTPSETRDTGNGPVDSTVGTEATGTPAATDNHAEGRSIVPRERNR